MGRMRPMLATKGDHVPVGPGWIHEVKWDGMRTLVEVDSRSGQRTVRLWSRNENDVSISFPELSTLGQWSGPSVLVDGEVVAFADGVPSFGALASRMHVSNPRRAEELAQVNPVTLLVFDVLRVGKRDLCDEPLTERRSVLESLGLDAVSWQVPGVYDDGAMLREATLAQGLEGIVSKRLSSRYQPGLRTRHWLKFPHRRRASYVVGGWRLETDSADRLGALLVGEPTPRGLVYRGRVGSGIAGKAGLLMRGLVEPLARATSPFADDVPRLDALGTRWVEPILVVDVESLGLSSQSRLRQPAYVGLRSDLTPVDILAGDR